MNWVKWYYLIVVIIELRLSIYDGLDHGISKKILFNCIVINLLILTPVFLVLFGIIK